MCDKPVAPVERPPYSAPFTEDVPQCCGEPETCNDPCAAPTNAPVERSYGQVHETGYVANPVSDDAREPHYIENSFLIQKINECERDAARYRWLRASWLGAPYGPMCFRTASMLMEKVFARNVREYKADGWMLDLDAAIDAAMRGKP